VGWGWQSAGATDGVVAVSILSAFHARGVAVRTDIAFDSGFPAKAMAATGLTTKKATEEDALRPLLRQRGRAGCGVRAGLEG